MVSDNCSECWGKLDRNYGGYRIKLQEQADAEDAQRRMYEARNTKTAVLLSEAYRDKQRSIKQQHENRRQVGKKRVKFTDNN